MWPIGLTLKLEEAGDLRQGWRAGRSTRLGGLERSGSRGEANARGSAHPAQHANAVCAAEDVAASGGVHHIHVKRRLMLNHLAICAEVADRKSVV